MYDRFKHVCIHEMSHFVVYLYLGGSPADIRAVQIRPRSGYLFSVSHPIAENYFTFACLALAGPVSDILISDKSANAVEIQEAKNLIRTGLRRMGADQKEFEIIFDAEYQAAWDFTESIVFEQRETILRLSDEASNLANNQYQISRTKIQRIARQQLSQWQEDGINYYPKASEVNSSLIVSLSIGNRQNQNYES